MNKYRILVLMVFKCTHNFGLKKTDLHKFFFFVNSKQRQTDGKKNKNKNKMKQSMNVNEINFWQLGRNENIYENLTLTQDEKKKRKEVEERQMRSQSI